MGDAIAKVTQALGDPSIVRPWLEVNGRKVERWIRRGEWGPLLGGLTAGLFGWNAYTSYLARRNEDGLVTREIEINGSEMVLDPSMEGISRELIMYGGREELSAHLFEAELERLADRVDAPVTVLEVGANIGYYALLEANVLGDDARILAFEPDSRNIELLTRSIERNGYGDRIDVEQAAVGDTDGTVTFNMSSLSNKSHVDGIASDRRNEIEGQVTVPQKTTATILAERDVAPEDVNVVRMDVEGYEARVFRGMADVLESDHPMVIFLELHPNRLGDETYRRMLDSLEESGFEIAAVTDLVGPMWYEVFLPWNSFDDLRESDHGTHLILRRTR